MKAEKLRIETERAEAERLAAEASETKAAGESYGFDPPPAAHHPPPVTVYSLAPSPAEREQAKLMAVADAEAKRTAGRQRRAEERAAAENARFEAMRVAREEREAQRAAKVCGWKFGRQPHPSWPHVLLAPSSRPATSEADYFLIHRHDPCAKPSLTYAGTIPLPDHHPKEQAKIDAEAAAAVERQAAKLQREADKLAEQSAAAEAARQEATAREAARAAKVKCATTKPLLVVLSDSTMSSVDPTRQHHRRQNIIHARLLQQTPYSPTLVFSDKLASMLWLRWKRNVWRQKNGAKLSVLRRKWLGLRQSALRRRRDWPKEPLRFVVREPVRLSNHEPWRLSVPMAPPPLLFDFE